MMHPKMFEYVEPTPEQIADMALVRAAAAEFALALDTALPEGPDKTHVMRLLRTLAMWANAAITRQPDGSPRK